MSKSLYTQIVNVSGSPVSWAMSERAGYERRQETLQPGQIGRERSGYCERRGELRSVLEMKTGSDWANGKGPILPANHPKAEEYLKRQANKGNGKN